MEIKLKENSSLTIKNSQGNEICSVTEDGTVSGYGTKLYHHYVTINVKDEQTVESGCEEEFVFEYISTSNSQIGGTLPWTIISNNLSINALSLSIPNGRIIKFYSTTNYPPTSQFKLIVQSTISSTETEYLLDVKYKYDVTDTVTPL